MTLSRRKLLAMSAVGLLPRISNGADPSRMIVRSPKPEDLEMPLDAFTDWITPIDRFFVRCHTYTPTVKLSDWSLKIDGKVDHPQTLTMTDLKALPRVELVSVLECAGNGRSFYEPHVAGSQWAFGSVGNGRWTGVRLRDVLQKAGIQSSGTEILFDGADVPLGKMQDFQRTITRAKALHPDTLLAYQMNGQDLPVEHGFPLRVIAPGWASDSWVKWVQHIEVLDHEFEGFWMKSAYRHPPKPVAPGTAVDPADMVPVTDLNVKSVIAAPREWAKPGTVRIQGTAWSNSSPVSKVEVSTDGGKTWKSRQTRRTKDAIRLASLAAGLESHRGRAHPDVARHQYGRPNPAHDRKLESRGLSVERGSAGQGDHLRSSPGGASASSPRRDPASRWLQRVLFHLPRRPHDAATATHPRWVGSRIEQDDGLGRPAEGRGPRGRPELPRRPV